MDWNENSKQSATKKLYLHLQINNTSYDEKNIVSPKKIDTEM